MWKRPPPVSVCLIRKIVILLFPVIGLASACGGSDDWTPTQPTTPAPPPAAPPPGPVPVPAPTGLPSLAACSVFPNYVGETDVLGHGVALFRRERFPLRVSIASGGDTDAYREGIEKGLVVWTVATGGVIGAVEIGIDWPDADLSVQVGPHPVYNCRTEGWHGIFADGQIAAPRIVRGGRIYICPENFGATPSDVLRVAKLVGHEMGHALGIGGHSTAPADLMYEDDASVNAPAGSYPWVTTRDINTLGTAYCN